jgi:hypothetical protein
MRVLATISDISRLGVVLDLESGASETIPVYPDFIDPTVKGRVGCRPFGITWSPDELFIANNRQLLVFDRQLEYLRTETTPLQINTHQLAYHSSRAWAVSPWTNSLIGVYPGSDIGAVEFALFGQNVRPYVPRETAEADDKWHFNSLLWAGGYLFVAAHNFDRPSFINRYDAETLRLNAIQDDAGVAIHGLALCDNELFWLSTKTGEIRSSLGYSLSLFKQGYARGFAMTREHFVVATSQFLCRDERCGGDSWIQVIDRRQGALAAEFHLPDTGSINDLRLLDEYDYAHCVNPFWVGSKAFEAPPPLYTRHGLREPSDVTISDVTISDDMIQECVGMKISSTQNQ